MNTKITKSILGVLLSLLAHNIQATTINDLNLNNLSFKVIFDTDQSKASGSSNGVEYTFNAASNFYHPFSNTNSSQDFNDLPGFYDDIHAGSSFTINFDTPINSLLIALANDNNTLDGPNFGLQATDFKDITFSGSQSSITDIHGALIYFEFSSAISSIEHINNTLNDGWDLAFFANPEVTSVPLPAAFWFLGSALLSLVSYKNHLSDISLRNL